jgi:hypothetical protein
VSTRAVGTCRNDPCGQMDQLWEDGFCSGDCREQATGCDVPLCGCAGGCGAAGPGARLPTGEGRG